MWGGSAVLLKDDLLIRGHLTQVPPPLCRRSCNRPRDQFTAMKFILAGSRRRCINLHDLRSLFASDSTSLSGTFKKGTLLDAPAWADLSFITFVYCLGLTSAHAPMHQHLYQLLVKHIQIPMLGHSHPFRQPCKHKGLVNFQPCKDKPFEKCLLL